MNYEKTKQIMLRLLALVFLLTVVSCDKTNDEIDKNPRIDYRQEMRNFVQKISTYSKQINPAFVVIPQNGVELVGKSENSPDMSYLTAIDVIGQEDLLYGYDNDDQATSSEDTRYLRSFLDMAKNKGNIKILVTDYCSTQSKMDDSYSRNHAAGYISFAADHRELDNIPAYPHPIYNENADDITDIHKAKNFLYLINPDNNFASAQAFVDSLAKTNYDLIIMDLFYDKQQFTVSQIAQLKYKANGGKRILICYMSIGEAENYRYYWQSSWDSILPNYIVVEDPEWKGNFVVRYWDPEWQNFIYGNDSSYTKKILDAGFDGVYLDIIDAFEWFEK